MSLFPSANDFKSGPGVKGRPPQDRRRPLLKLVGRDIERDVPWKGPGLFWAFCRHLSGVHRLPDEQPARHGAQRRPMGVLAGPVLGRRVRHPSCALCAAGYWWTTYRKAFKQNFKASILPGVLYCVVVTVQVFLVYFCFQPAPLPRHQCRRGDVGWATVLNLVIFRMLFSYMWPGGPAGPLGQTLKNSVNCMIAFLPHALAASLVTVLCSGASSSSVCRWACCSCWCSASGSGGDHQPDRLRRPRPGVPHRGEHPQAPRRRV